MDDNWWSFLLHPVSLGFGGGLIVALYVLVNSVASTRKLKEEIRKLNGVIEAHAKMMAVNHATAQKEIDELKRANENLRISVANLEQKPGRAEILKLQVYDTAVRTMNSRAPGFGPAWETAFKEAEERIIHAQKIGLTGWVRKVISPSFESDSNHRIGQLSEEADNDS